MNKKCIWAPEIVRQMTTGTILVCEPRRTNCVFQILREVGAERNASE